MVVGCLLHVVVCGLLFVCCFGFVCCWCVLFVAYGLLLVVAVVRCLLLAV